VVGFTQAFEDSPRHLAQLFRVGAEAIGVKLAGAVFVAAIDLGADRVFADAQHVEVRQHQHALVKRLQLFA
jgi:hypothetical protein